MGPGRFTYRKGALIALFLIVWVVPSISRQPGDGVGIAIDTNVSHQEVLGFGGFLPMLPWWLSWNDYSESAKRRLFDTIFDELGCSVIRLPFPAGCELENDNDDPFSLNLSRFDVRQWIERDGQPGKYDGEVNLDLYVLDQARQHGITRFIMSAYSVAPWLKDSQALNGGSIIPELYDEFAETMAGTLLALKRNLNLDVYCVSIFNEPDYVGPYATTKASPETVSDLIIRTRRRLDSEGLRTLVGAPEHNRADLYRNGVPWIAEEATRFLGAYVFHQYGNFFDPFSGEFDSFEALADFGSQHGIPIIQNEISNHKVASRADTHEEALYAATHLHQALVRANVQIWNWWVLYDVTPPEQSTKAGQRLIYFDEESGELWLSPKAYALRQYYKYIPAGSRRVEVSQISNPLVSAFVRPDGEITVVAINNQGNPQDVTFTVAGRTYPSLYKIEFSEQRSGTYVKELTSSTSSFSDTLAPLSVSTFSSASEDKGTPPDDKTPPLPPTGVKVRP